MNIRDFFKLIIKLFGLYSLISIIFTYLPSTLGYLNLQDQILMYALGILAVLTLMLLFYILLVKKTDKIIDFLKLDTGFEGDKFDIGKINETLIIKLASLIVGGLLIVENLPKFLNHSIFAFVKTNTDNGFFQNMKHFQYGNQSNYFSWIISFMNLLVGYLIITNYKKIANKLIKEKE